jgi:hypothetical protein
MPASPVIPAAAAEFLRWHNQFNAALAELKDDFSLPEEDLTLISADNQAINARTQEADLQAAKAKQAIAARNEAYDQAEANARAQVKWLKAHRKYTKSLGVRLGIPLCQARCRLP